MTASAVHVRRLFFGLWPDDETREALHHATRVTVRHCGGKPVPPRNYHVTLAFLGNVPEERCEDIAAAGARRSLPELTLTFDRYGYFAAPQVLWLGSSAEVPALRDFVAGLWRALAEAGAPPDARPFHPHVSLARKVTSPPELRPPRPVTWAVRDFALIESETLPEGARYRPVATFGAGF